MNKRWKVLFGALTMSAMLAAGCGPNTPTAAADASDSTAATAAVAQAENTVEAVKDSSESSADSLGSGSKESLGTSTNTLTTDSVYATKPADAKTLDSLADILKNSGLPYTDFPSSSYAVRYYDPTISGDIDIICYDDGEAEFYFNCDNNTIIMEFYRPSGTYLSYDVRGITKDHVNSYVFSAREIPLDGKDFAEFSKDILQNSESYLYYDYYEDEFTEDLATYKENFNTLFARFGVLSNGALNELGLSWEDFGIHFGEEYKKYDACVDLVGLHDKTPLIMEKQTFTNGISDSTGKTWIETLRNGIKTQAIYNAYEGQEPSSWFAYNDFNSNNFIDGSDYVQFETYRHEDGCRVYYHTTDILENSFSTKDFNLDFEDNEVWISYEYENDFRGTSSPGVVTSDTWMGFSVSCKPEEVKDIFASEASLKAALEKSGYLGEDSQYMTNDEMIADFMTRYKRYMGSIDDGIKTMGTCFADFGIEY